MSNVVTTSVFIDRFRLRESAVYVIAGALRNLEKTAETKGERVIWASLSFNTETDYHDEIMLRGTNRRRHRTLNIEALTIDPAEVTGA